MIRVFYSNILIAFLSFILPVEDCSSGSRKLVVFNHFSLRSFLNFKYVSSWLRPFNIFININIVNLSQWNITVEKKCGLASVFSVLVACAGCGTEDVVKTFIKHRSGQRGPLSHDCNSRSVYGCLQTGIGETHVNNLLCKFL